MTAVIIIDIVKIWQMYRDSWGCCPSPPPCGICENSSYAMWQLVWNRRAKVSSYLQRSWDLLATDLRTRTTLDLQCDENACSSYFYSVTIHSNSRRVTRCKICCDDVMTSSIQRRPITDAPHRGVSQSRATSAIVMPPPLCLSRIIFFAFKIMLRAFTYS